MHLALSDKTLTWRSWAKLVLGLSFSLLAAVILFNYFVDSSLLFFNRPALQRMAGDVAADKAVIGVITYDERLFHKLVVEQRGKGVSCIAVGSSRIMQMRERFLRIRPPGKFYNHGMSGARLEDYVGIAGLYKTALPECIILGVDPWIFNKSNSEKKYASLSDAFNRVVQQIDGRYAIADDPLKFRRYGELLKLDAAMSNFRKLYYRKPGFYSVSNLNNPDAVEDFIREPDGSIHLEMKYRKNGPNPKKIRKRDLIKLRNYSLLNFPGISNTALFEDFIRYLQARKTRVIVLLVPFHPAAYEYLASGETLRSLLSVERYVRAFASANAVPVVGSYDPAVLDLKDTDFIDMMHPRDYVMQQLADFINQLSPFSVRAAK